MKILLAIFAAVILYGCVTTGTETDNQVQQLNERLAYLEAGLKAKENQISDLENELKINQDKALEKEEAVEEAAAGSERLSVKQIQAALKNAGFYHGPIDGKIGKMTRKAIKAFQEENGLKADGMVGKNTASKLNKFKN